MDSRFLEFITITSIFPRSRPLKVPLKVFNHTIAPDPYLHMVAGTRVIIHLRCAFYALR